jgi:hypothetical protein
MFRRNRMLRNLFGSPCEKAETRRRKPMVKPHLEKLADRILPSASSLSVVSVASPPPVPQVAAATSYLASTMDQLGHLIATVEQNVIGDYQALGQEVSNVLYQLDHLLGITPNDPNQPLNTTMQQAGSGSGSGSGAMSTDHEGSDIQPISSNTQNQPLIRKTQLAGSGSGTDSYGQSFVWEPVSGGDYLWSDPNNWSNHVVPQNGAPAYFTGTYNSKCIVDTNTTQGTIFLENGFTAPIEIEGELNIPGYEDDDIPADDFNVVFLTPDAPMNVNGNTNRVITPGRWNVGAGGQFNVTNNTVINFGIGANLTQSSGSPINVTQGTLNFGDATNSGQYSTFKLTNAAANINIGANGFMNLYQTGDTLIDSSANPGAVISNKGNVTLKGVAGAGQTDIAVPLQNHKTFNVYGGDWWFTETDTNNDDLSMDAGTINLSGNATIVLDNQFTQTGGALSITDAQETFEAISGAVNFNGGTVNFTSTSGYGTLNTFNLVFNGATLNMRIKADSSDCDLITLQLSTPTCTIKGNSTINVTLNGAQTVYSSWTLIESSNTITGDFQTVNLPNGIYEEPLSSDWGCHSTD